MVKSNHSHQWKGEHSCSEHICTFIEMIQEFRGTVTLTYTVVASACSDTRSTNVHVCQFRISFEHDFSYR